MLIYVDFVSVSDVFNKEKKMLVANHISISSNKEVNLWWSKTEKPDIYVLTHAE